MAIGLAQDGALEYLGYGSNMLTAKLVSRVPSARNPRVVALPGYAVLYRKRSKDGSAKCDLVRDEASVTAYGVVFDIDSGDKPRLDVAEGLGYGYHIEQFTVNCEGVALCVFAYLADQTHVDVGLRPYAWYRDQVVQGELEHDLPRAYVRERLHVPAIGDPNRDRCRRERRWLSREQTG